MKQKLGQVCLLMVALLSGGCLEFEEQTMWYRHIADQDELRIYQDYRGIYGRGETDGQLTAEGEEQLASVLEGKRTFFFDNWIFQYNREALEKKRAELDDPNHEEYTEAEKPILKSLLDLLIEHVEIENGTFYLDADGKLCGTQSVTVSNVSEITEAGNEWMLLAFEKSVDPEKTTEADRRALAGFMESKDNTIIQLDGNSMIFRMPTSRKSYDNLLTPTPDGLGLMEQFEAAGFPTSWADGVMTAKAGKRDDQISSLTFKIKKNEYLPNVIAPLRKLRPIEASFDAPAAAKRFLLSQMPRATE